jgi:prepilin-type N-terminal cleavage/methylation domain-containing protein/prepilin-type processing-associated H-X9-DG protein
MDRGHGRTYVRAHFRRLKRAFTLIELLVVISIIVLMIAILLPVLGRARDAARRATCLGNIQQLNTATHCYAADFNELLPVGPATPVPVNPSVNWSDFFCNWLWIGATSQPTGHGVLMTWGYLHDVSAVVCPGADQPEIYQADLANLQASNIDVFSAYAYRSYDQTTRRRISDLGVNAAGLPARMLFFDVNRHGPAFLQWPATNHREEIVNIGYLDGHATTRDNRERRFSALEEHYVNFPVEILRRFRQIIVTGDFAENGDPANAPILP